MLALTESITKILAILMAGAWAYYHYFRGRTYRPRLEPTVTGVVANDGSSDYLIVTLQVKNVGLSRVGIIQKGSGLRISTCTAPLQPLSDVAWKSGGVFSVFLDHGWIEPGEPIQEKYLFALPQNHLAVHLQFRLLGSKFVWNAHDILLSSKMVPPAPPTEDLV
jgi:hypothetical protein